MEKDDRERNNSCRRKIELRSGEGMIRTGIFCLYTPTGTIDSTIISTLRELRDIITYLIVVVNGKIHKKSELKKYADEVLIRNNTGFDAGAYTEILLSPDYADKIKKSDELVLCNSSFYGPFISFRKIFEKMEGSTADFWGISSSEKNLVQHIQSYFLVFRRKVLEGNELFCYLRDRIDVKNIDYFGACSIFENGLFWTLKHAGYEFDAYKRNIDCDNYVNPYGSVKIDRLPVLKRKIFSKEFYEKNQAVSALSYIRETYHYPIESILENVYETYEIKLEDKDIKLHPKADAAKDLFQEPGLLERNEIEKFIETEKQVFLYGNGEWAQRIFSCFFFYEKNPALKGFVVSDTQEVIKRSFRGYPIFQYSEIKNQTEAAFLVALNQYHTKEVLPLLRGMKKIKLLWKNLE